MDLPYNYVKNYLVIEIKLGDKALSDIANDEFFTDLTRLNKSSSDVIAFDLSGKDYFNSSDLGMLIKIKDFLFDQGIRLVLIKPSPETRELFRIVGVSDFFKIIDSEEDL